ncbi:MAG: transglutaminase family protein [Alphaproteobacteria bacterium]|nr:transglutaminase family protein [Alphaproteobacteria bacterium]
MLYDISMRLVASYDPPANDGRYVVCMAPADLPGRQRAITSLLTVDPRPIERSDRTDFFGNAVVEVAFKSAHAEIAFAIRSRVDRTMPPAGPDISPPLSQLAEDIAVNRSLAPSSPHHFLAASPRVRLAPEFLDYARLNAGLGEGVAPGVTVRAIVEALGAAIHRDMTYDVGATSVDTRPEEAFAARHGVCQDYSHIMIAGLRSIGIPAGYVSGFLRTLPPPGQPRLEGADAMHAWVRAWCGASAGWWEYDPTNAVPAGDSHIVVAYGRDYGDVAPVRGVLRSSGTQDTKDAVDVVPVDA